MKKNHLFKNFKIIILGKKIKMNNKIEQKLLKIFMIIMLKIWKMKN